MDSGRTFAISREEELAKIKARKKSAQLAARDGKAYRGEKRNLMRSAIAMAAMIGIGRK